MKKLINILLASMFLFTITGCDEEDVIVKTPGEITGEKIDNLLLNNACKNLGRNARVVSTYYRFHIDGQYLIFDSEQPKYYDLNHLVSFEINSDKTVLFYFESH